MTEAVPADAHAPIGSLTEQALIARILAGDDWTTMRSESVKIAEYFNSHQNLTTDAGAVLFGNTVTIVLGIPDGAVNTVTVATPTTWQADNGAYDAAGNACSTATITGSGSPRIDF